MRSLTVRRERKAGVEEGRFDLGRQAVGVRAFPTRRLLEQALGAEGRVIAADLGELLAGVAPPLAGFADVAAVLGEFSQAEFAACSLLRGVMR
jgi:hypothetical protein